LSARYYTACYGHWLVQDNQPVKFYTLKYIHHHAIFKFHSGKLIFISWSELGIKHETANSLQVQVTLYLIHIFTKILAQETKIPT
jgi:hypothetical protein